MYIVFPRKTLQRLTAVYLHYNQRVVLNLFKDGFFEKNYCNLEKIMIE